MFREAIGRGRRIGMLATFPPSVATMEAEFAEAGARVSITGRRKPTRGRVFVDGEDITDRPVAWRRKRGMDTMIGPLLPMNQAGLEKLAAKKPQPRSRSAGKDCCCWNCGRFRR